MVPVRKRPAASLITLRENPYWTSAELEHAGPFTGEKSYTIIIIAGPVVATALLKGIIQCLKFPPTQEIVHSILAHFLHSVVFPIESIPPVFESGTPLVKGPISASPCQIQSRFRELCTSTTESRLLRHKAQPPLYSPPPPPLNDLANTKGGTEERQAVEYSEELEETGGEAAEKTLVPPSSLQWNFSLRQRSAASTIKGGV
ncbi:Hypothetical predicted protein [Xyrichtys novacula]|uniref:Uncharacterized protein n=1 Tax=Xyrichtys novacula TaxID=13765 RepID=A0AAV1FUJ5_XYRNO|nr:Hypothetical predicted protein [Xyrichtys novacula]